METRQLIPLTLQLTFKLLQRNNKDPVLATAYDTGCPKKGAQIV